MKEMGYIGSVADPTPHLIRCGNKFLLLLIYVDDIHMFVNEQLMIELVILIFKAKFKMRTSKRVDQVFGVSIADNGDRVKLHNKQMIERISDHSKMSESSPVLTLLPARLDLSCEIGDKMENSTPFRQLIPALMHLANTLSPDISYAGIISHDSNTNHSKVYGQRGRISYNT